MHKKPRAPAKVHAIWSRGETANQSRCVSTRGPALRGFLRPPEPWATVEFLAFHLAMPKTGDLENCGSAGGVPGFTFKPKPQKGSKSQKMDFGRATLLSPGMVFLFSTMEASSQTASALRVSNKWGLSKKPTHPLTSWRETKQASSGKTVKTGKLSVTNKLAKGKPKGGACAKRFLGISLQLDQ